MKIELKAEQKTAEELDGEANFIETQGDDTVIAQISIPVWIVDVAVVTIFAIIVGVVINFIF